MLLYITVNYDEVCEKTNLQMESWNLHSSKYLWGLVEVSQRTWPAHMMFLKNLISLCNK